MPLHRAMYGPYDSGVVFVCKFDAGVSLGGYNAVLCVFTLHSLRYCVSEPNIHAAAQRTELVGVKAGTLAHASLRFRVRLEKSREKKAPA